MADVCENRRRHTRMPECLPVRYRIVTRGEGTRLESEYQATPTADRRSARYPIEGARDPVVAALLVTVLEKIDELLRRGQAGRPWAEGQEADGLSERATCVNLSVNGLRMRSDRRLAGEERLDLLVAISSGRQGSVGIRVMGRVVWESEPVELFANQFLYESGVEFTGIHAEDRARIEQYLRKRSERQVAVCE